MNMYMYEHAYLKIKLVKFKQIQSFSFCITQHILRLQHHANILRSIREDVSIVSKFCCAFGRNRYESLFYICIKLSALCPMHVLYVLWNRLSDSSWAFDSHLLVKPKSCNIFFKKYKTFYMMAIKRFSQAIVHECANIHEIFDHQTRDY